MQWTGFVLELVKTIGLGSLFGVIIGLGATRGQKKQEALYAIKAANYREIVADYRELSGHLHKVEDSLRSMTAVANTLFKFTDGSETIVEETETYLLAEYDRRLEAFEALEQEVSAKLGAMMTHRSETEFHANGKYVLEWCTFVGIDYMYFRHTRKQEDLTRLQNQAEKLQERIHILRFTWDDWKVQAERFASGMRPTPRLRGYRIHTERLM